MNIVSAHDQFLRYTMLSKKRMLTILCTKCDMGDGIAPPPLLTNFHRLTLDRFRILKTASTINIMNRNHQNEFITL